MFAVPVSQSVYLSVCVSMLRLTVCLCVRWMSVTPHHVLSSHLSHHHHRHRLRFHWTSSLIGWLCCCAMSSPRLYAASNHRLCCLLPTTGNAILRLKNPGARFTEDLRIIVRQFSHLGDLKTMAWFAEHLRCSLNEFSELVFIDRKICHS